MILRPVRPQSPRGPPTTNRPVGLTRNLVPVASKLGGKTGLMISSMTPSRTVSCEASSACCVERTTVSSATGRKPS